MPVLLPEKSEGFALRLLAREDAERLAEIEFDADVLRSLSRIPMTSNTPVLHLPHLVRACCGSRYSALTPLASSQIDPLFRRVFVPHFAKCMPAPEVAPISLPSHSPPALKLTSK